MPTKPIDDPRGDILDEMHAMLTRLVHQVDGHDDGVGTPRPGLRAVVENQGHRIARIERIIASGTAFFLGVASLVAGAWAALWFGPHK